MGAIDSRTCRQATQLLQRVPHLCRRALEQAAASQGKERVAAKEGVGVGKPVGNMPARMARHEENLCLCFAKSHPVAFAHLQIDARNSRSIIGRSDDPAARGLLDLQIAPYMVA